jgi:hypothetical protein
MTSIKIAAISLVFCLAAVTTHKAHAKGGGGSTSSLTITNAFLSASEFYAYGLAKANSSISLNGVAVTRSDAAGNYNIQILNYSSPPDCLAKISDGASTVSKAITSCALAGNAGTLGLDGVSSIAAGSSGSMILYAELVAPAAGFVIATTSGMPSVLSVAPSVLISAGNSNVQIPYSTSSSSIRYQAVSVTAKSGPATATKNVVIEPSLSSWNVTGEFSITAQGANYCSPYAWDRSTFDASIIATATDFMKTGESGVTGVNPGVERISVKTLNLRCSKSFPTGHQITSTGNVIATNTSVTGGARCFQAKQNYKCSAGTKNALVSHMFAQSVISYAAQNTVTGRVCLSRVAAVGGAVVSLVSRYPTVVSVPVSVTIPAGSVCADYSASINLAGQPFGYDYDVIATYDGFPTWAKFVVNQ